jgi:hypothetical protein
LLNVMEEESGWIRKLIKGARFILQYRRKAHRYQQENLHDFDVQFHKESFLTISKNTLLNINF